MYACCHSHCHFRVRILGSLTPAEPTQLFIFSRPHACDLSPFSSSTLDLKCPSSSCSSWVSLSLSPPLSFHPITHFQLYHFLGREKTKWPLRWYSFFPPCQSSENTAAISFHWSKTGHSWAGLVWGSKKGGWHGGGLFPLTTWQDNILQIKFKPTPHRVTYKHQHVVYCFQVHI